MCLFTPGPRLKGVSGRSDRHRTGATRGDCYGELPRISILSEEEGRSPERSLFASPHLHAQPQDVEIPVAVTGSAKTTLPPAPRRTSSPSWPSSTLARGLGRRHSFQSAHQRGGRCHASGIVAPRTSRPTACRTAFFSCCAGCPGGHCQDTVGASPNPHSCSNCCWSSVSGLPTPRASLTWYVGAVPRVGPQSASAVEVRQSSKLTSCGSAALTSGKARQRSNTPRPLA